MREFRKKQAEAFRTMAWELAERRLLTDGRYAYMSGWCDYTGWGCQDGAQVAYFDERPLFDSLQAASEYHAQPAADEWDKEPADLNRWLESARTDPAVPNRDA